MMWGIVLCMGVFIVMLIITAELSERISREWERSSNEWRALAVSYALAAAHWKARAERAGAEGEGET